MARLLAYGGSSKEIVFNYRVAQTLKWDDRGLRRAYGLRPRYPDAGREGNQVVI